MAVYTSVKESDIKLFLKQYNLGSLVSYEGILEGIENTNYKINTNEGSFILTLFEKRVDPKDLPFFMSLQKHLSDNKFICPIPIQNKDNNIVNTLCNKKAIIISFLEGKKVEEIKAAHCLEVGEMISNFQNLTKNFILKRKNNLLVNDWKNIFVKCLKIKDHKLMVGDLKRGDEVVTSGGIVGKIEKVYDDDKIDLLISENVTVKVVKSTIQSLIKDQKIKK